MALQRTAVGWKAFAGDKVHVLSVPTSVDVDLVCTPPAGATLPAFGLEFDDGQQGFVSVNNATGVETPHVLSNIGECIPTATDVIALGNSYVDGPQYSALFYFSSGETVFWLSNEYSTGEPSFVGYEGGKFGVLNTSTDGHKIGFALFNR